MNIVIPFRNTCGTKELDMCIKLIRKNLKIRWDNIYILGDKFTPKDKKKIINLVIDEQKYNKWLDNNFLIKYYINNISSEPFILFNDDFFLTSPVYEINQYYNKTLEDRIKTTYIIEPKINQLRLSMYGLNIKSFISKYGNYNNFEVHIPIIINYPKILNQAIEESNLNDCPAMKRTLYMYMLEKLCLNKVVEELQYDCKFNEPLKVIQYPYFSLTDDEFKVFEKTFENILNK